jgi:hypothetical protein
MTEEWEARDPSNVWLVEQMKGSPAEALDDSGAARLALLTIAARRNHATEERMMTYALTLEDLAQLISGLMITGTAAFGREQMMAAAAESLGALKKARDS